MESADADLGAFPSIGDEDEGDASFVARRSYAEGDASDNTVAFGAPDDEPDAPRRRKKASEKKGQGGFQSMGLGQNVFKAIVRKGYRVPTPIQRKVIRICMAGRDCVAMARTGSGKTAAFLIPMLERLHEHNAAFGARGVILSPTRELALQTSKFATELGHFTNLRSVLITGGESLDEQFAALQANPDIVVATPGRLMQHLQQTDLGLSRVQMVVFDEADRLFEMGFADQLREIMMRTPDECQTCLFSATMPKAVAEFTRAGLNEPAVVRLDTETKVSENLTVTFFTIRSEQRDGALLLAANSLLKNRDNDVNDPRAPKSNNSDQTIVFVSTRHHVEWVAHILQKGGFTVNMVYGAMDQASAHPLPSSLACAPACFYVVQ